jgi:phosphoglycerate dehydrogenase-like enzyme
MNNVSVAICSRSFSKNIQLRSELIEKYSSTKFNDEGITLEGQNLVNFLKGFSKAIIGLEKIDDNLLKELPQLRVISKYGVGTDSIDMLAMAKHGIRLGWTPGVNKRSVSELVLCQIINLLRMVSVANQDLINGNWGQFNGLELTGKSVGIIGCGHIGQDVITLMQPFKCKFMAYDIKTYDEFYKNNNVEKASLENLLKYCDVVSLHLPLNAETSNILDKNKLNLLKQNAILINFARGGLVDEQYLKNMLLNRRIYGAAFDVFENEPFMDADLIKLDNFIATPHIGGSSKEGVLAMGRAAIHGLEKNKIIEVNE